MRITDTVRRALPARADAILVDVAHWFGRPDPEPEIGCSLCGGVLFAPFVHLSREEDREPEWMALFYETVALEPSFCRPCLELCTEPGRLEGADRVLADVVRALRARDEDWVPAAVAAIESLRGRVRPSSEGECFTCGRAGGPRVAGRRTVCLECMRTAKRTLDETAAGFAVNDAWWSAVAARVRDVHDFGPLPDVAAAPGPASGKTRRLLDESAASRLHALARAEAMAAGIGTVRRLRVPDGLVQLVDFSIRRAHGDNAPSLTAAIDAVRDRIDDGVIFEAGDRPPFRDCTHDLDRLGRRVLWNELQPLVYNLAFTPVVFLGERRLRRRAARDFAALRSETEPLWWVGGGPDATRLAAIPAGSSVHLELAELCDSDAATLSAIFRRSPLPFAIFAGADDASLLDHPTPRLPPAVCERFRRVEIPP